MSYNKLGDLVKRMYRGVALAVAGAVLLSICAPVATVAAHPAGVTNTATVKAVGVGLWKSTLKKVNGAWKSFNGKKVVQCFLNGVAVGTGLLTTLVKAPRAIGTKAILVVAALNGVATYVKCSLA